MQTARTFVDVGLTQHERSYFDENGTLQLKVAPEISGEPLWSAATPRHVVSWIAIACG